MNNTVRGVFASHSVVIAFWRFLRLGWCSWNGTVKWHHQQQNTVSILPICSKLKLLLAVNNIEGVAGEANTQKLFSTAVAITSSITS